MSVVKLENINKRYDTVKALKNVSFGVQPGEILLIIGPSGSGKTTLLKIMAGLETDFEGTIWWGDTKLNANNIKFLRSRSTMVFQKSIMFNTTIYKNIAYGLKMKQYSTMEIDRKVQQYLKIVGLQGYESRNAKKISGGEQQRVSIARALALEPELLLLDEPTANLDPKNVAIIEEVISLFKGEHYTKILVATHNLFQAERLAKRVYVLMNGEIVQTGTSEEVFKKPGSASLASFMKYENVFHGTATATGEKIAKITVEPVQIEAITEKTGGVTIFIRPEDVVLSTKPFTSSIRNIYKGRIIEITDVDSTVKLKIDAGIILTAIITKQSFLNLSLNLGSEVYTGFKATAVDVI